MIGCLPGFHFFMVSLVGVRELVVPAVDDVSDLDDSNDRPGAAESRTRPPPPATTPLPLTVSDGSVYFLSYNRVKNIYLNKLQLSGWF
jgi:hypothetical protein